MKNKFLHLVGLLSALGVSPISNAMQQNALQQNNVQLQNNQNSQKSQSGFTGGQVAAFTLGGAAFGAIAGGIITNQVIDRKKLTETQESLEVAVTNVNYLQTELDDKNKKIKDFEKQVKNLNDENKKLKQNPPQPGGFSETEKKNMQNQISQLESELAVQKDAYTKLLNANGNNNAIVEELKKQIDDKIQKMDSLKLEVLSLSEKCTKLEIEKNKVITKFDNYKTNLDKFGAVSECITNAPPKHYRDGLKFLANYFPCLLTNGKSDDYLISTPNLEKMDPERRKKLMENLRWIGETKDMAALVEKHSLNEQEQSELMKAAYEYLSIFNWQKWHLIENKFDVHRNELRKFGLMFED